MQKLDLPTFINQFKCPNPSCGKAFEPVVTKLLAEIVEYNPDLKGPERTQKYREISVVVCGNCDTVIGVLPELQMSSTDQEE